MDRKTCKKCKYVYSSNMKWCPNCYSSEIENYSTEKGSLIERHSHAIYAAVGIIVVIAAFIISLALVDDLSIFLSIILCVGCFALIVFSVKKIQPPQKTNNNRYYNDDTVSTFDINSNKSSVLSANAYYSFHNNPVNIAHFEYLPIITESYRQVTKSCDYYGPDAEKVIRYCLLDINIAEDFYSLYQNYNQELPRYSSFQTLAILYEHRKEYKKAIDVCKRAISLGFDDDGTKGKMYGRILRLEKKLNSNVSDT